MTGWAVGLMVAAFWAGSGIWWLSERAERRFQEHADEAMRLTRDRDRHPASRAAHGGTRCACDQPDRRAVAHGWDRCQPVCVCRRRKPDREPTRHGYQRCEPLREVMS